MQFLFGDSSVHLEKELGSTSGVERGQSSLSPNRRGDLGRGVFSFLHLSSPRPSSSSYLLCPASQDGEMFPEPSRLECCFNMSHQRGGMERSCGKAWMEFLAPPWLMQAWGLSFPKCTVGNDKLFTFNPWHGAWHSVWSWHVWRKWMGPHFSGSWWRLGKTMEGARTSAQEMPGTAAEWQESGHTSHRGYTRGPGGPAPRLALGKRSEKGG